MILLCYVKTWTEHELKKFLSQQHVELNKMSLKMTFYNNKVLDTSMTHSTYFLLICSPLPQCVLCPLSPFQWSNKHSYQMSMSQWRLYKILNVLKSKIKDCPVHSKQKPLKFLIVLFNDKYSETFLMTDTIKNINKKKLMSSFF